MYHEIPVLFYVSHTYTSSIFFFILIMYTLLLIFLGKCFIFIHWLFIDFVNLFTFSKSSGGFLLSFCTVSYYISSPNCSIRIKKRTGTCNSEICTASGICIEFMQYSLKNNFTNVNRKSIFSIGYSPNS